MSSDTEVSLKWDQLPPPSDMEPFISDDFGRSHMYLCAHPKAIGVKRTIQVDLAKEHRDWNYDLITKLPADMTLLIDGQIVMGSEISDDNPIVANLSAVMLHELRIIRSPARRVEMDVVLLHSHSNDDLLISGEFYPISARARELLHNPNSGLTVKPAQHTGVHKHQFGPFTVIH